MPMVSHQLPARRMPQMAKNAAVDAVWLGKKAWPPKPVAVGRKNLAQEYSNLDVLHDFDLD
ncbi:hypothetical protein [Bradyrhizobium sp. LHD-71]|uniref:hypothetical protein n=1 Tax=Bradyrhizobium sp. LHD-71 TaxID=3072141 RepID=UPI0035BE9895